MMTSDLKTTISIHVRTWLNEHVRDPGGNPYELTKGSGVYDCMDAVGAFIDFAYDDDEEFETVVRKTWNAWMNAYQMH